jgi:hypothetical protein
MQYAFDIEHSLRLCLYLLTEENISGFRLLESKFLSTLVISVVLSNSNGVNLPVAKIV